MSKAQAAASIWKNRTFSKMFAAYSISSFGDWFDLIAMMVLFNFVWKADPFVVSLVPLMYAVPGILFGHLAGVVVDRWKKLNIMIIADFVRAFLTAVLFFAPSPYVALGLMLLRSSAAIFNAPAQQALIRNTVAEDQLLKATTFAQMVNQLSKVLGPLLGSALIAFVEPQACLIVNAVSFVLSGLLLLTIGRIPENESAAKERLAKQTFFESWREGWALLLKARLLFASTCYFLCCLIALEMVNAQVGVLIRTVAPDNASLLGYVVAMVGIGTLIVGAFLGGRKSLGHNYGWLLGGAALLLGIGFGGMGLFEQASVSSYWLLLTGGIAGLGAGMALVTFGFVAQKATKKEAMGRINGIINSLASVVIIGAPMIGSALVKSVGVFSGFRMAGLSMAGIGVIGLVCQRLIWGKKPASSDSRLSQKSKLPDRSGASHEQDSQTTESVYR